MGKKGSWFSAIKRAFVPSSKDKLVNGSEKTGVREKKKKGLGKLKHGDSFIPLFREPSSIEKILGDAERDHSHLIDFRPLRTSEQPKTPSFPSPRAPTPLQDAASQFPPTPPNLEDSPPEASSSRTVDFSPRNASPQRVITPPKIITPQRVSTPPKNSTLQRVATPPKGSTSQLSVSPQKSSISQRTSSSPIGADVAVASSQYVATSSNAVTPPKSTSSKFVHRPRPEPTLRHQHVCAARIQAAYRGYVARRSYRALRGLVRLQGVVKGQSVKRQTASTMKSMQLLVRVQTQIQSRRIQMLENQAIQRQAQYKNDNQASENSDDWDDSTLTKDEVEARRQRKFEAIAKRERALAYAYSHQSSKTTPKTAQAAMLDIRASGGYPWWWNWLDRQMNPYTPPTKPSETQPIKNLHMTPPRPGTSSPLVPHSSGHSQLNLGFDNSEAATPRSTRSAAVPSRMKLSPTPSRTPGNKFPWPKTSAANRSPFGSHFKDDDSLTSCPQFSVPRYMEPTMSAKAKVKGEFGISPIDDKSKRRVSYPLSQGLGSFKWSKRGSLFSANTTPNRETGSQKALEKQSVQSVGNRSVDSSVSMPAAVGRKPFNRFV